MTKQTDSWREEFSKRYSRVQNNDYNEVLSFIEKTLQAQRTEDIKNLIKEIDEYPERLFELMPDHKLPFVVFNGKADEAEKWTIYIQGFNDMRDLLRSKIIDK